MTLLGALPQFLVAGGAARRRTSASAPASPPHVISWPHPKIETRRHRSRSSPRGAAWRRSASGRATRALDDPRSRVSISTTPRHTFPLQQQRYGRHRLGALQPVGERRVGPLFSVEGSIGARCAAYLRDGGLFLQRGGCYVYEMSPRRFDRVDSSPRSPRTDGSRDVILAPRRPDRGRRSRGQAARGSTPSAFANPLLRAELEPLQHPQHMDGLRVHTGVAGRAALALASCYCGSSAREPRLRRFAPVLDLSAGLARFLRQQADAAITAP